ncbi:MAG: family 16 glycoside hydrolase [Planctomycetaceae bacterium]
MCATRLSSKQLPGAQGSGQVESDRAESAKGNRLQTWVNGVPAADLKDDVTAQGFLALQVHATRNAKPLRIRWRNMRIRELR